MLFTVSNQHKKNMNSKLPLAISLKILNGLLFTLLSLSFVRLNDAFSMEQLLFLRMAQGAFFLGVIVFFARLSLSNVLVVERFKLYVMRSFLNVFAMLTWVYSLKNIGMNEATAISYTGPLWILLFAFFWVGERPTRTLLMLIPFNLVAMLLIVQPHTQGNWVGLCGCFLSTLMWATYDIVCKKQTLTEHPLTQAFVTFVLSSLICLPLAFWRWTPIPVEQILPLSWVGLLGVVNVIVLFLSYSFAPITKLLPFNYCRLIFALAASYFFLNQSLSGLALVGVIGIFCSNLYFAYQTIRTDLSA